MDGTAGHAATPTVVIDGYALGDGSLVRGIGTYLTHLLAGLADQQSVTPVVVTTRPDAVPAGIRTHRISRVGGWRFGPREHDLRLPFDLRRVGGDVLHSPAQHPPRRASMPWVQTLLDVTPLVIDDPSTTSERRRWERLGPRLRDAAAIIAISEATATAGIKMLGLDPQRVHVVHLGVDDHFRPAAGEGPADPPYLLHVGAWGPHKGHALAFELIGSLAGDGAPHRLVVGGFQDAWMSAQLEQARLASVRPDRIEMAGFVDDLPALYRGATALIVTSRSEGFCLPALEAMACGTPVVAFANTALPEVVGDAGVLVPDGDLAEMAAQLKRLIADPAWREELSQRAVERARRFDWRRTVDGHVEIYRAVAGA
jgi:glycosyltransferase involved in cell wall biosynthesis